MPIDETPLPHPTDDEQPPTPPHMVQPSRRHSLSTAQLWVAGLVITVLAAGLGASTTGLIMTVVQANESSTSQTKTTTKHPQSGQGSGQQKRSHPSASASPSSQNN